MRVEVMRRVELKNRTLNCRRTWILERKTKYKAYSRVQCFCACEFVSLEKVKMHINKLRVLTIEGNSCKSLPKTRNKWKEIFQKPKQAKNRAESGHCGRLATAEALTAGSISPVLFVRNFFSFSCFLLFFQF